MSNNYIINKLNYLNIQAICRALNRYIRINMLDKIHLIHSKVLYLLLTTIDIDIHPNWAVMVHSKLIKAP